MMAGHGERAGAVMLALLLSLGAGPGFAADGAGAGPTRPAKAPPAKESPLAAYLSGRVARGAGDWGRAASSLTAALAADPDNKALLTQAFLLNLGEGNIPQALTLARAMERLELNSLPATALLVSEDLGAGRIDAARARLARKPGDPLAQYMVPLMAAWVEMAGGKPDMAKARLQPLLEAPGLTALAQLQLALMADQAGRTEEAATAYDKALEGGPPLRVVQLAGNFQERTGHPDQARRLYEAFAADNPGNLPIEEALARLRGGGKPKPLVATARDGLAESLFQFASALHQDSRQEMSLLYGRISLFLRAEQPLTRLMIGDVLAARQRHEQALAEYRTIGGTGAAGWAARLREADALRRLDRDDEAVKLLQTMAAERPDRTDALVRLGDLYRAADKDQAAIDVYDKAIARAGGAEAKDWVLFFARGMALEAAGRWPEAEADLKAALQLRPDEPQLLNYLGYSYVDRNLNLPEAKVLIERAVAQLPDNGQIVDSLGWVLYRTGDLTGAVEQLEKAVQLSPADPAINDHLGDVYWAVGRKPEARFQWRRAVQLAQDDATLRGKAEEKLKNGLPQDKTAASAAPAEAATPR